MHVTNGKTALYRLYDESDRLLYVGVTNNMLGRMSAHAKKPWFPEVRLATFEHFSDRGEALAAEKEAIVAELPAYNITHNAARVREAEREVMREAVRECVDQAPPLTDDQIWTIRALLGPVMERGGE